MRAAQGELYVSSEEQSTVANPQTYTAFLVRRGYSKAAYCNHFDHHERHERLRTRKQRQFAEWHRIEGG
jgi:ribosomal protein S26